ncbi:MAG: queuosine precursor transporter [Sporocytophaga sp.]|uniref:queuosine precursor transporter n=1 Tax=Sporocytophaga sp. TaxID=2231183 RepID=UPI001B1DF975|nr:queuosine precursor transporter [Sporocytophaga sp.]MBO9703580.1 queuosine precursor transporter [Sporocytophaga sp.]
MKNTISGKKMNLFIFLTGIFLVNALTAEIIGPKIFSLEALLGFKPAQIPFWNNIKLDFNLTAGAIIWPVVFITTDIINEYFGKDGVKKISYLAAALIAYGFGVIYLATDLPPAEFWIKINNTDHSGTAFNIDYAYGKIFRQGFGIMIGSILAFLISQLLDAYVFHTIKNKTGGKGIWLRATLSTLVSQLIDSFLVLYIAFYIFGGESQWSLSQVFSVGIINYIYKFSVAVILTPLLYVAHYLIDIYLKNSKSENAFALD